METTQSMPDNKLTNVKGQAHSHSEIQSNSNDGKDFEPAV